MRHHIRFLLGLLTILFVGTALGDVVCRAPLGISGFDAEAKRAKRFFNRAETRNLNECEVYLTRRANGTLYLHSNFLTTGFDVTTKIATNRTLDLLTLLLNIVGEQTATLESLRLHRTGVRYYLDQSMFDNAGEVRLELNGAENLFVAYDSSPPPRRLERANNIRGPPFIAEWSHFVFVRVSNSFSPPELFSFLSERPFNRQETRFTSLISNSAVADAINAGNLRREFEPIEQLSANGLQRFIEANHGKTLVLLGHIENERFIARDAIGQNTLLEIPLTEVEAMAARNNCDLVLLGCQSADSAPAVGVRQVFNPVAAVQRLERAFAAVTCQQFVDRLSSAELILVFGEGAFREARNRASADIYANDGIPGNRFASANRAGRLAFAFGRKSNWMRSIVSWPSAVIALVGIVGGYWVFKRRKVLKHKT